LWPKKRKKAKKKKIGRGGGQARVREKASVGGVLRTTIRKGTEPNNTTRGEDEKDEGGLKENRPERTRNMRSRNTNHLVGQKKKYKSANTLT